MNWSSPLRVFAVFIGLIWSLTGNAQTVALGVGWNLVGNSSASAISVATAFGNTTSPVAGVTSAVTSVWTWNGNGWNFYSPSFADGGAAYAASKQYGFLTQISVGQGFWVNTSGALNLSLPNPFSGTYTGGYSGGDSGTWQMTISSTGTLTGTGVSAASGSLSGSGTVKPDGGLNVLYGSTSNGANFAGSIHPTTKAVTGIWSNSFYGLGGSFSGSRVGP